jgi:hypothetical protein
MSEGRLRVDNGPKAPHQSMSPGPRRALESRGVRGADSAGICRRRILQPLRCDQAVVAQAMANPVTTRSDSW